MNSKAVIAISILVVFFFSGTGVTQEEFPRVNIGAVLDGRFIVTDQPTSWLNGELGKNRYGGENNESRQLGRLSQASLLLSIGLNDSLSARVQLSVDAEHNLVQKPAWLDLVEGLVTYRAIFSPHSRLRIRGGFFFPPVSLENTDPGWTSPFAITTSAINSWIGEEVRATGVESTFAYSWNLNEVTITGAAFGNNDPAGTLLAWRGWALHDRQTRLTERLPLAPIPPIGDDGLFPKQPDYDQPFCEVDGRVGFYGASSFKNRRFEWNGVYYDNRGNQNDFDGSQYAWNTRFFETGLSLPLPHQFQVLTQYMAGRSKMGVGNMVNIDFDSFYALATDSFGKNRITARYDQFRVRDRDRFEVEDNNNENGYAWAFAYIRSIAEKHRFAFEVLRIHSTRPERATLQLPVTENETLFQTGFRLKF